jgi:hypothetical protein
MHRHDRHHQGQTTTTPRQCPFHAGCDSEEKRFLYRSEDSRTLRGCLPPTAFILSYQALDLKSKTKQQQPEILLRRYHRHHLRSSTVSIQRVLATRTKTLEPDRSPPTTEPWPRRPRHSDQTTHYQPRNPGHEGQDAQTRALTTHHRILAIQTKTPTHSPPILRILDTKSKTPKHRHPPSPGPSNPRATNSLLLLQAASLLCRRRLRSSSLSCVGSGG